MPSLKLNFSTGSVQTSAPSNTHQTTQQAALYKSLYRTPQGTVLAEDVSSEARLTAIYAANAAPGQQVITYARASTNGNGVQRAPTGSTSMAHPPPPPPKDFPNQPPSYVRPGTSLHQWATERASQEQDHRRDKVTRQQRRQFRREGGLQVALEARLQKHAAMTANKLDCRWGYLAKPKKDVPSGWKSAPSPMPMIAESLGEERPPKRVKLTCGERAPPSAPMMAPQRPPTPLPRQKLVPSNRPPAPIRSLTPVPQPSGVRGCTATDFQRPYTPLPLHARLAEPTVPKKHDEEYSRAMARLGGEYAAAFERWDAGMVRTLPGYRESMERRGWFATRWTGPNLQGEEGNVKRRIDREGHVNF